MASDPSGLLQALLAPGGITGASFTQGQQNYDDSQLQPLRVQQGRQQIQLNQQKIADNQAQVSQAAQYQQDEAAYAANPTPDALNSLIAKYPAQFQALQAGWKIKSDAQTKADVGFLGSFHSALAAGAVDLAMQQLEDRRDAEAKAGIDTTEIDQKITALKNNEPGTVNALKGYALAHIAAAGDDYAKAMGIGGDKTHVISAGGALVGDDGTELYKAAPSPTDALQVPIYDKSGNRIGTQLVPNGGRDNGSSGAPASTSGGATAGARVHGWTPRGPNPDAAVDAKNAGMAKTLGIGLTDQFPTNMSNMQIAQALSQSEGGPGSLADRNNNPANLTDPKTGAYRKFPNKQAGFAAAAAQVARNRARGQNTIQTMVEGLPTGGSAAPSGQAGYYGPQGGTSDDASGIQAGNLNSVPPTIRSAVQAIADGRAAAPRAGTRNGEALLDAVTAYDPTFDAANATSRVKTRVDFTSGKSAQAVTALNTAMGHLFHLDDQVYDLGNSPIFGGLVNPIRRAAQTGIMGSQAYTNFEQTKVAAASEMRKVFSNTNGGTLPELQAWEASLDSAKSPEQLHGAIKNGVILMGARLDALRDQYAHGMNRSDMTPQFIRPMIVDAANHRFGIDLGNSQPPRVGSPAAPRTASRGTGFRILSVRPK